MSAYLDLSHIQGLDHHVLGEAKVMVAFLNAVEIGVSASAQALGSGGGAHSSILPKPRVLRSRLGWTSSASEHVLHEADVAVEGTVLLPSRHTFSDLFG